MQHKSNNILRKTLITAALLMSIILQNANIINAFEINSNNNLLQVSNTLSATFTVVLPEFNNLEAEQNNDSILLNWEPIPDASRYRIYVNNTYINEVNSLTYFVTNLQPNTEYVIKVAALSDDFLVASSTLNITTKDVPVVENIQVTNRTSASFDISWDQVVNAYKYSLNKDFEGPIEPLGNAYSFTDLAPNHEYIITINAADNDDDTIAWSAIIAKTLDKLNFLQVYYNQTGPDYIKLHWDYQNNSCNYRYRIQYGKDGNLDKEQLENIDLAQCNGDLSDMTTIEGLEPGSEYSFRVIAYESYDINMSSPIAESTIIVSTKY